MLSLCNKKLASLLIPYRTSTQSAPAAYVVHLRRHKRRVFPGGGIPGIHYLMNRSQSERDRFR
jgi:hypothetical protein